MTDLVKRCTVRELVAAFQAAEAQIRASFAALVQAEGDLNAAFGIHGSERIRIDASRHGFADDFDDPDQAVERMARQAWRTIVDRLEMRRAMSIARYAELQQHLDKGPLPPITEANVTAFAERYASDLPAMLREAVQEVFDWLRPPRSEYKTNSELEIGRRVILAHVVDKKWSGRGFTVTHHRSQRLIALENVFHALDGRGQIGKDHYSLLQRTIETSEDGAGETDLFAFRVFANGNMHLTFKRLDLLARFNAIAGGARLRPAA